MARLKLSSSHVAMTGSLKMNNCSVTRDCVAMHLSIWRCPKGNVEETF
jgi:hypothetical protein